MVFLHVPITPIMPRNAQAIIRSYAPFARLHAGYARCCPPQLFNPPYVPTPDKEVERVGIARAWAGGHLGRRVTDRLIRQVTARNNMHMHAAHIAHNFLWYPCLLPLCQYVQRRNNMVLSAKQLVRASGVWLGVCDECATAICWSVDCSR